MAKSFWAKAGIFYVRLVAAGPAFEGAHIGQGMRAGKGAIEKVRIENGKISLGVIGNRPPAGICGSGLSLMPLRNCCASAL